MRHSIFARCIWPLFGSLLLLVPLPVRAASYYWSRQPQHERLVFHFDTVMPPLDTARTSATEITLRLPQGIWKAEARPAPFDLTPSRLVAAVRVEGDALVVQLRREDVDYLAYPLPRENKIVLELTRRPKTPPAANATEKNATPEGASNTSADTPPPPENASAAQLPPADVSANTTISIPHLEIQPPAAGGNETPAHRMRAAIAPAGPPPPSPHRVRSRIDATATPERPGEVLQAAASPTFTKAPSGPQQTGGESPSAAPGALQAAEVNASVSAEGAANPAPPAEPPAAAVGGAPESSSPRENADARNATAKSTPPAGAEQPPASVAANTNASAETVSPGQSEANATDAQRTAELENLFQTVQETLARGDIPGALDGLESLRRYPDLPDHLREEVLYTLAELRMKEAKDDLASQYLKVREAFLEALNFNPASVRAPQALINLGYLNLAVGNEPEAKAYFDLLRRKYPRDFHVPLIDYYWGEYFSRRGQWSQAADHFQAVIQQYPDSQPVLQSAVGLVRALAELGFWAKAWEIVDFVEKRWPRYYIDDPEFLSLAGQVAMNHGLLDAARERLWLYYNLMGDKGASADMALARIGDIYLRQNSPQAAKRIYEKAAAEFPDKEGGLIAMMRLAEEGIVDSPTLEGMAAVFDRPFSLRPERIYTDIVTRFPDSPLAPIARLKLAMWYLWTGRFDEAVAQGRRFLQDYPQHALASRAKETIFTALTRWMARDAEEENYRGIVTRFEANPDMAKRLLESDRLRLALAMAYLKLGQPEKTLEIARPFFYGSIAQGEFSLPALDLALAVLVDLGRWSDVVDLASRVKDWNLGEARQRQVDYALALAFENLNQEKDALAIWRHLAIDVDLPPTQRGHALYFLARAAYAEGEWEQAYTAAQEALSLLLHKNSDPEKIRDALAMLTDITENTGRLDEALMWAEEYERRLEPKTPQWSAWVYRKAQIERRLAREEAWRASLNALIDAAPDSLYARMARSDLTAAAIAERLDRLQ
ncbi:MAG: Tetratricopeptide domain protein [Desulfomicrobiaceae bacterium]|nr:Tetratricopeptide domain protein [Desulfomicrobiaceae bacterium]